MTTRSLPAEGESATGATSPTTPEQAVQSSEESKQPSPLTIETIQETVRGELNAFWQAVDQRVTNTEMKVAEHEEMRAILADLVPDTKRNRMLIEQLTDSTLGREVREKAEQQFELEAIKTENARLKTAISGQRAATNEDGSAGNRAKTAEAEVEHYNTVVRPRLKRQADKAGVDLQAVIDSRDWPKDLRGGWEGFEERAEAAIDKYADAQLKAAAPKPVVDNLQQAGNVPPPLKLEDGGFGYFLRSAQSRRGK